MKHRSGFVGWLLSQDRRDDEVGRLARDVAKNREWRTATFSRAMGRLVQALTPDQLAALCAAYQQFRIATK